MVYLDKKPTVAAVINGGTIQERQLDPTLHSSPFGYVIDLGKYQESLIAMREECRRCGRTDALETFATFANETAASLLEQTPITIDEAVSAIPMLAHLASEVQGPVYAWFPVNSVELGHLEYASMIHHLSNSRMLRTPVVLMMGTDRMGTVAQLFSVFLRDTDARVVIVGSMTPDGDPGTPKAPPDAQKNLRLAGHIAIQNNTMNVVVAFDDKVISGADVLKPNPTPGGKPHFESPHGQEFLLEELNETTVNVGDISLNHWLRSHTAGEIYVALENSAIYNEAQQFSAINGAETMLRTLATKHKYIILNGTGSGNISHEASETVQCIINENIAAGDPQRNIFIVTSDTLAADVNWPTPEMEKLFAFNNQLIETFGQSFILTGRQLSAQSAGFFAASAELQELQPNELQEEITIYCQKHFPQYYS